MKRKIIAVLAASLAAAAAALILIPRSAPADEASAASEYIPEEKAVAVEAEIAQYDNVIPFISASGLITGVNEAVLVSETRGVIRKLYADIGSYVEEGDPILDVDSSVAKLSMQQAENQLQSARIEYNSVKRAFESGSASKAELSRSSGQLSGAEALYMDAVNRFESKMITAPFSGYLADIEAGISPGNFISEGSRIAKVVDLSAVEVDLFLGGYEVQKIMPGSPAVIETASKQLEGEVGAIALSSDLRTGSFRVVIRAGNPFGREIRSGFAADVRIEVPKTKAVVVVPASSVFDIGGGNAVYVVSDRRAALRRIETGAVSGNRIEVKSGIEAGEAVVTTGFKNIRDGSIIIPRFAETTGGAE